MWRCGMSQPAPDCRLLPVGFTEPHHPRKPGRTPISEPWHYELPAGAYPPARGKVWVKADMIATVAITRLDRIRIRERGGQRSYQVFHLGPAEMLAIGAAMKAALGLP
jgi:hypothetical protein